MEIDAWVGVQIVGLGMVCTLLLQAVQAAGERGIVPNRTVAAMVAGGCLTNAPAAVSGMGDPWAMVGAKALALTVSLAAAALLRAGGVIGGGPSKMYVALVVATPPAYLPETSPLSLEWPPWALLVNTTLCGLMAGGGAALLRSGEWWLTGRRHSCVGGRPVAAPDTGAVWPVVGLMAGAIVTWAIGGSIVTLPRLLATAWRLG